MLSSRDGLIGSQVEAEWLQTAAYGTCTVRFIRGLERRPGEPRREAVPDAAPARDQGRRDTHVARLCRGRASDPVHATDRYLSSEQFVPSRQQQQQRQLAREGAVRR